MNAENTPQLTELRKALGPDVVIGLIDLRDVTIVADCRPGSSSPETDFADPNPRPPQNVFGVACGRVDQATLCAVLFRKRAALDQFWADNPKTRSGLVTRWPGVRVLWLRVTGIIPKNLNLGECTWCSRGVVPVGSPDLPMNRFIAQPGNVPVVDFRDLQWHGLGREAIQVELLEQEFGPRFRKTSKRTVLNLQFWSRFLVKQLNLSYDPAAEKFQARLRSPEATVCLTEGALIDSVGVWLQKLSR
jgi:hypothetical protein